MCLGHGPRSVGQLFGEGECVAEPPLLNGRVEPADELDPVAEHLDDASRGLETGLAATALVGTQHRCGYADSGSHVGLRAASTVAKGAKSVAGQHVQRLADPLS